MANLHVPQEYESIYKANNAVMSHPSRQVAVPRRKRNDEEDDEDREMRYVPLSYVSLGASLIPPAGKINGKELFDLSRVPTVSPSLH